MKLLFCFFACITGLQAAELVFRSNGKELASISMGKIRSAEIKTRHGSVKAMELGLYNVFRQSEHVYEGYDFFQLLDAVYGKDWKKRKTLSFTAADGYVQFCLIDKMLVAAKGKTGFLAYAEKGLEGLGKFMKNGKQVDPGPLYLVWSNFSKADKASHADVLKWPYQLASINLE